MTGPPPAAPDGAHAAAETSRQRRVTDQLLSMHSYLRDRKSRTAKAITASILVLTALGSTVAFACSDVKLTILGVTADRATWVGFLTFATFALVLVDLVLDQRGEAAAHADAARRLADLKARYRDSDGRETADRLTEHYVEVTAEIVEVPAASFNRLKSRHLRKIEVSKLLSEHKGMSVRKAKRLLKTRLEQATRAR